MRGAILVISSLLLFSCDSPSNKSSQDSEAASRLPTIPLTLPNGKVIRVELATDPTDQQRGLMYRTELAADRGMLFVFPQSGYHPFWMYHTLIPLDIIWLHSNRSIIFISADTPLCPPEKGENCPHYGEEQQAQFVLELAAGAAAANGLKLGETLRF